MGIASSASRCARELLCILWIRRTVSKTSMCGRSTPKCRASPFQRAGVPFATSARRSSASTLTMDPRSPVVERISSVALCVLQWTPSLCKSFATTSLLAQAKRRVRWHPRPSSSLIPSRCEESSLGPRDDVVGWDASLKHPRCHQPGINPVRPACPPGECRGTCGRRKSCFSSAPSLLARCRDPLGVRPPSQR